MGSGFAAASRCSTPTRSRHCALVLQNASVLAGRADGTLFAVRLEYSAKSHTKEAIRTVQDLGANVLGVFVTEVRGSDPDHDPRLSYRMRTHED